jgi:hypothetical protein
MPDDSGVDPEELLHWVQANQYSDHSVFFRKSDLEGRKEFLISKGIDQRNRGWRRID